MTPRKIEKTQRELRRQEAEDTENETDTKMQPQ